MPLDKSTLINFLTALDKEISREITLVAVGGTAMTLLDLKPSTIDIDFTIPHKDLPEFNKTQTRMPHGFKIHTYTDGTIFSQTLPEDYLERSIKITDFKHVHLRALHPIDIVVTKIGRLDERDLQDIEECIKKYHISRNQIEERAANVQYAGKEENYLYNLQIVLQRFF
jgi:hypothetical protein